MLNILRLGLPAIVFAFATGAASAAEQVFVLTLTQGAVAPDQQALRATKGDTVRVRVVSDAPGELHLHGYQQALTLSPGIPAELVFLAHATGRYRFEWHRAGAPGSGRAHHGPPLAVLEVRPR